LYSTTTQEATPDETAIKRKARNYEKRKIEWDSRLDESFKQANRCMLQSTGQKNNNNKSQNRVTNIKQTKEINTMQTKYLQ
jgi:hypothetical protein